MCGVRTLANSDRSVGSKWMSKRSHPLGCMETCTVTRGVLPGPLSIDPSPTQLYILWRC